MSLYRQFPFLGACKFLFDVMKGSELASILLITSSLVMARLNCLARCSLVNFTTLLGVLLAFFCKEANRDRLVPYCLVPVDTNLVAGGGHGIPGIKGLNV